MDLKIFLLYSSSQDVTKISALKDALKARKSILTEYSDDNEIDDDNKKRIHECDIFICCLSKESPKSHVDIAKFARCIGRENVNTLYLEQPPDNDLENNKHFDKSFFRTETNEFMDVDSILKHVEEVSF